jgi:hypothetical protein
LLGIGDDLRARASEQQLLDGLRPDSRKFTSATS